MEKPPTDLKILKAIYKLYYDTFAQYTDGDESRSAKIYVPIDIDAISKELKVDGDIIFGRLYYHLEKKHGYKQDDDTRVPFFALRLNGDIHCVNFPLMASVLADLSDEAHKHNIATWIALGSLLISIIALVVSICTA